MSLSSSSNDEAAAKDSDIIRSAVLSSDTDDCDWTDDLELTAVHVSNCPVATVVLSFFCETNPPPRFKPEPTPTSSFAASVDKE